MKINQSRRRPNNNNVRKINSPNHTFDSQGPDGKIRGTSNQIFEKYMALARDATSSGDRISAEYFYQYADHYYRIAHADNENEGTTWHDEDRRYPKNRPSTESHRSESEEAPASIQTTSDQPESPSGSSHAPVSSEEHQSPRENRFENRKSRHPYLGGNNARNNSERPRRPTNRPAKPYTPESASEDASFSRSQSNDQDVITVIQ